MRRLLLLLVLGLPPLVALLAQPLPRIDSDAVEYFSHLRSLYFDHDLDFANEFDHFGILTRGDKVNPTPTGHRRTIFSVGPALLWMPFYAAGDAVARLRDDVEDGYSASHIRAVTLGSLAYGLAGLLLVHGLLVQVVPRRVAFWTVFLLEYATFLWWYMVDEPLMSHACSFFAAAAVVALWWRGRAEPTTRWALLLGLVIGASATVRWQNGVFLLLPAASFLPWLRTRLLATVRDGLLTLFAFAAGTLPQLLAWKAIFGRYLLLDPPHGADFLRLDHPYLLQTFFSSRHGLLYWTPILWAGYLGFALLVRRERRAALALLPPLVVMSYVNACSGDWWAGGSFSNRRFDCLLPFLAFGLAAALAWLVEVVARRPGLALTAGGAALVAWNALLMLQYRENLLPLDETVAFSRITENSAALVQRGLGTPLAWPANWLFAAQQRLPVASYDLMVGKYLFYRQNNLGGVIDLGDPRGDPALVGPGWTSARPCENALCRGVLGTARLFAPLDVPEPLTLVVRARGEGTLGVAVNGAPAGVLSLAPELRDLRLPVPAQRWRRELNELRFSAGGSAQVDRVAFERERPL